MEHDRYISKKISVEELIEKLKKALVYEIMAAYEYWVSAEIAVGMERKSVAKKFRSIMKEEQHHADQIALRIKELGGCVSNLDFSNYPKADFSNNDVMCMLKVNIKGEVEAMDIYYDIIEYTENRDHITNNLITEIFTDEAEHKRWLCDFVKDIEHMQTKYTY